MKQTELGPVAVVFYWIVTIAGTVCVMVYIHGGRQLILLSAVAAIPATVRLFDHYRAQYRNWRTSK